MPDFTLLPNIQSHNALHPLLDVLPGKLAQVFDPSNHGDLGRWQAVLDHLPEIKPSRVEFDADAPIIGVPGDCTASSRANIEALLRQLHPWRKGPYLVHGVH